MTYKALVRDETPGRSPGKPRLIYASDSRSEAQTQLDFARDVLRVTGTGKAFMTTPKVGNSCGC